MGGGEAAREHERYVRQRSAAGTCRRLGATSASSSSLTTRTAGAEPVRSLINRLIVPAASSRVECMERSSYGSTGFVPGQVQRVPTACRSRVEQTLGCLAQAIECGAASRHVSRGESRTVKTGPHPSACTGCCAAPRRLGVHGRECLDRSLRDRQSESMTDRTGEARQARALDAACRRHHR